MRSYLERKLNQTTNKNNLQILYNFRTFQKSLLKPDNPPTSLPKMAFHAPHGSKNLVSLCSSLHGPNGP